MFTGVLFGILTGAISGAFPQIYNTTDDVRALATRLILVMSVFMPWTAYGMVIYFTIRSGGKVFTTVFYDSITLWIFGVPVVYFLSRYTDIAIIPLYICGHIVFACKAVIGTLLVQKGNWVQNLIKK